MPTLDHALVLGGSLAGLFAARVLADHARRVTLVERDPLPAAPGPRKGTPQARHANNLVAAGVEVLEQLFPRLAGEIVACGASRVEVGRGARVVLEGVRHAPVPAALATGAHAYLIGRPRFEALIRAEVLARPEVELVPGDAVGLLGSARAIAGASVRAGGADRAIEADLVVDALGRGSPGPRWLAELGAPSPVEQALDVDVRYATRTFPRRPGDAGGDVLALITPGPGVPRGGIAMAIEDDRWLVTLYGYGVTPPTELAGFRDYAASLAARDVAEIAGAEPLDDGAATRFPTVRWRRHDRLRAGIDGYLPVGDVVCALNPCYGMGTASAAFQARALAAELPRGAAGLAARVHRGAAPWIARAFELGRSSDLRLPGVDGADSTPALIGRYLDRARRVAGRDPVVALAFRRIVNLLDPRTRLLHPRIARRVLARGAAG